MGHKFDTTIDTKVVREAMVKSKPLPTKHSNYEVLLIIDNIYSYIDNRRVEQSTPATLLRVSYIIPTHFKKYYQQCYSHLWTMI